MMADSGAVTRNPSTVCLLVLKWVLDISHVSEDGGAMHSFCSLQKKNGRELKSVFRDRLRFKTLGENGNAGN